jgi:hypothetical protein
MGETEWYRVSNQTLVSELSESLRCFFEENDDQTLSGGSNV